MNEEVKMRRLLALLQKEFGPVESATPKLTIVKKPAPVKKPSMDRPAIFALGPIEARRRAAQR